MIGKSTPVIVINNIPIGVVPNSVTYKKGFGETTVRAASIGGGAITTVHTENVENKVGMVKFQIHVVDALIQQMTTWKANINANTVSGIDVRGIPFNLILASMVNDPDIPPTADGVIDVEFQGDPMAV